MPNRSLFLPPSVPGWRELGERVGLLARANVLTPITETLRRKGLELAERQVERRRHDAAVEATAQRMRREAMRQRNWAGAQMNRLTADWISLPTSLDADVRASAKTMRARARQLRRDNPLATRFVQLQSENIVGPHGFGLQCRIGNTRNGTNEAASDAIEEAFYEWSQREYCTVDQKLCLSELLATYVEMWKTDGEAFLVMHPGFPNKFGFALQLVDPDQVDDDYNIAPGDGQNEVRMGIEVDKWGREVAFHILTRHPGDWYGSTRRVRESFSADRVLHRFTPLGAGQTRGITPLAPVMLRLQMLGGSQEALIILQRTAACKMGFLEVDPELAAPLTPTSEVDGEANVEEVPPVVSWDAEPGRIEQLPRGFKFSAWDPGAPTQEYEALRRSIAEEVSVGLGVSYASLTGDQSRANFGSQRVAMTSERDGYKRGQQTIIGDLRRVFAQWGTAAMFRGAIAVPSFNVDALTNAAEWQPRGFDWIDPEKDVAADLASVNAGLTTLTDIAAERGSDFFENIKKRQREIAAAAAANVPIVLTPKAAQPPTDASGDQPPTRTALALTRQA